MVGMRSEFLGCFPERKADSSPQRWRATLNSALDASGVLHPEPGLGGKWSKNVGCFREWELVLPEAPLEPRVQSTDRDDAQRCDGGSGVMVPPHLQQHFPWLHVRISSGVLFVLIPYQNLIPNQLFEN